MTTPAIPNTLDRLYHEISRLQANCDQAHAALAMIQILVMETLDGPDQGDISAVARQMFSDISALCESTWNSGRSDPQARPTDELRTCLNHCLDRYRQSAETSDV